jgi:NAD(P)-dependent dehydrogenase (short-subunit alcohol dehydrogenase family)
LPKSTATARWLWIYGLKSLIVPLKTRSGLIILVTGSPAQPHVPAATAIGAAFGGMENLAANLAFELGPFGVRVVCLRTMANVDS